MVYRQQRGALSRRRLAQRRRFGILGIGLDRALSVERKVRSPGSGYESISFYDTQLQFANLNCGSIEFGQSAVLEAMLRAPYLPSSRGGRNRELHQVNSFSSKVLRLQ